ncbi:MAG: selenide, water dikinase SelD [Hyphomicrobiaceae bacterium]
MRATPIKKDLVLVGGGHAQVHVLRSFGMKPMPGLRITLIARDIETPYSGMLPGFIAGHYTHEQCHIDLQTIARFAGARLIHAAAKGFDLANRRVICQGRPEIPYDVLSIDIGSTPDLASIPGAAKFAIPLKPVDGLARRWAVILREFTQAPRPMHFVTVGGGAAGVEIALAIHHHLRGLLVGMRLDPDMLSFTVITRGEILAGHNQRVRRKIREVLRDRRMQLMENVTVEAVDGTRVHCTGGEAIDYDQLIWGTDARAAPWLADTGLELDDDGFIKIDARLNALGHPDVFAAGDVASNVEHPRPKAGVFAVRQGPPLTENIRLALAGQQPKPFVPQREFLSLISTGDRNAIASRSWWAASGPRVWRLKDWIDRTWMDKAKAVPEMDKGAAKATVATADDPLGALKSEPMRCGGCGAKVGATALDRALRRLRPPAALDVTIALEHPDDAAVIVPPSGKLIVQSVDFFRSFIGDPYVFGRIAANHATGDIYAMGADPLSAQAIAIVPHAAEDKVEDDLYQMLRGGLDVLQEAGASLIGGHSGEGAELALGFTVNGVVDPKRILRKSGSRPGDCIIMTKALGTGALFAAEMRAKARGTWIIEALRVMQQSNGAASRCVLDHEATAGTDVTGFGLVGHLVEMLQASKRDAVITIDVIPALPGAIETLSAGISSSLAPDNLRLRRAVENLATASQHPAFPLLFDPQTAGGLLVTVPAAEAARCISELRRLGYAQAAVIGEVIAMRADQPSITIQVEPRRQSPARTEVEAGAA